MTSSVSGRAEGAQRLLDAALTEIAAAPNGPGEVSLRAIARRAGLSHNAAQHHFGDRAGLFTAVATTGFVALADRLEEAISEADPRPGAALRSSGRAYLEFGLAQPNLLDLMFRADLVHGDDPELGEAQQRAFGLLQRAVPAAEPGNGPSDLAMVAWAFIHGLVGLSRHGALPTDPDQPSTEQRLATAFADLIIPMGAP